MDLATLVLLYQIGGHPERTYSGRFADMPRCEEHLKRLLEGPRPEGVTFLKWTCWRDGTLPPAWVVPRPIHGVPLDLRHMPSR